MIQTQSIKTCRQLVFFLVYRICSLKPGKIKKNREDEFPRRPRRSRKLPSTAEHQMAGLRRRDEEGTSAAFTSLRGLQLQAEEEDYWKKRILLHRENKRRQDVAEESRQSQERM